MRAPGLAVLGMHAKAVDVPRVRAMHHAGRVHGPQPGDEAQDRGVTHVVATHPGGHPSAAAALIPVEIVRHLLSVRVRVRVKVRVRIGARVSGQ